MEPSPAPNRFEKGVLMFECPGASFFLSSQLNVRRWEKLRKDDSFPSVRSLRSELMEKRWTEQQGVSAVLLFSALLASDSLSSLQPGAMSEYQLLQAIDGDLRDGKLADAAINAAKLQEVEHKGFSSWVRQLNDYVAAEQGLRVVRSELAMESMTVV